MNILLIRGKPTFMDFILGIPIGLAYIAPIAQRKGHHVEILDLALERDPTRVLTARLDSIGISMPNSIKPSFRFSS